MAFDPNPSQESADEMSALLEAAGYTPRDIDFAAAVQRMISGPPDAIVKMHTMHVLASARMLREVIAQGGSVDADICAALSGIVPLLRDAADIFSDIVKGAGH